MTREETLHLFDNCNFTGEVSAETFDTVILSNLPYDFKYDYNYGISKLVLTPIGENFVIKIPFTGSYEDSYYDYDEDGYEEVMPEYTPFEWGSTDRHQYWDYCMGEMLNYRKAKAQGADELFCKTSLLGFVNCYPIYIQQRAIPYTEAEWNPELYPNERTSKTKDLCRKNHLCYFNTIWQTDVLSYYGEKKFKKFFNFIDGNINDLHDGNLGYIGEKPVIFDYSGFEE